VLREGMSFHLLVQLMDVGTGSVSVSETVVVGAHGAESLSTWPRHLIEV
jgi:Xaa-Pro aminopeptidase